MTVARSNTYVCEVCGTGFGEKAELREHLFQHDPDKVEERLQRAI